MSFFKKLWREITYCEKLGDNTETNFPENPIPQVQSPTVTNLPEPKKERNPLDKLTAQRVELLSEKKSLEYCLAERAERIERFQMLLQLAKDNSEEKNIRNCIEKLDIQFALAEKDSSAIMKIEELLEKINKEFDNLQQGSI